MPASADLALEKLAKSRPPQWIFRTDDCISSLQFAPHGHTLLASSLSGQIVCLESATGKLRWQDLGHPTGALWLDHHPTEPLVASGGQDGTLKIWEANKGKLLQTILLNKKAWIELGAWSKDGKFLAVSAGKFIYFFDQEGVQVGQTTEFPHTVLCLDWHPHRPEVVAGTNGGIWIFRPEEATPQETIPWGSACLTLKYSPDGKFIAAGHQDQSVHAWPEGTQNKNDHLRMAGYATKVRELAWRCDSSQLTTGGGYNVITWDFSGSGPAGSVPKEQTSHTEFITELCAHPQLSQLCYSAAKDRFIFLWKDEKVDPIWIRVLPETAATKLGCPPSGDALAAGCSGGEICLYTIALKSAGSKI